MKKVEFNLEKAKAGAKMVTRDGKPARIICWDRYYDRYPIVALISYKEREQIEIYTSEGKHLTDGKDSYSDLFILEEPTIRPYANAEEMDDAINKHGLFVKNSCGKRFSITLYDNSFVYIGTGWQTLRYRELFDVFEWLDGTPCGVQE